MDLTLVLSAIIFTLLAVVVATSIFNNSSSAADFANARSYFGHRVDGADQPRQNGHVPDKKKKKTDDWCEISGSSHDHWDVVKSVLSVSLLCVISVGQFAHLVVCFVVLGPSLPLAVYNISELTLKK